MTIESDRIRARIEGTAARGSYVLYWMQQSQRERFNHALEHAVACANEIGLPVLVCQVLVPGFPDATRRHYRFMLEGLPELASALRDRGIGWVLRCGTPADEIPPLAADAALLVMDRGYLRIQRQWRDAVCSRISCPCVEVESDVVVPVSTVSSKREYSAATLRRKLAPLRDEYLRPLCQTRVSEPAAEHKLPPGLDETDCDGLLDRLGVVDPPLAAAPGFRGGSSEAQARLHRFVEAKLSRYHEDRSDPSLGCESDLSPYLHFGMISPVDIALQVRQASDAPAAAVDSFLEELVVRRELSMNFVHYAGVYDAYETIPEWAAETLEEHAADPRPVTYDVETLETARTHDPYWNAAQFEMLATGKMHNTMRMYWGKKILEWTASPREAYAAALTLNNRYELDGRDPNGFAGVAWCFGNHDRGWPERDVFGKVRYMNANGLERKYDIRAYVSRVAALTGAPNGKLPGFGEAAGTVA